jgi:hypothetical protein
MPHIYICKRVLNSTEKALNFCHYTNAYCVILSEISLKNYFLQNVKEMQNISKLFQINAHCARYRW